MLLLDEPTAGLDEKATKTFIALVKELKIPYCIISHNANVLLETCDRFYSVRDKKIVPIRAPQPHQHVHVHVFGDQEHTHD